MASAVGEAVTSTTAGGAVGVSPADHPSATAGGPTGGPTRGARPAARRRPARAGTRTCGGIPVLPDYAVAAVDDRAVFGEGGNPDRLPLAWVEDVNRMHAVTASDENADAVRPGRGRRPGEGHVDVHAHFSEGDDRWLRIAVRERDVVGDATPPLFAGHPRPDHGVGTPDAVVPTLPAPAAPAPLRPNPPPPDGAGRGDVPWARAADVVLVHRQAHGDAGRAPAQRRSSWPRS